MPSDVARARAAEVLGADGARVKEAAEETVKGEGAMRADAGADADAAADPCVPDAPAAEAAPESAAVERVRAHYAEVARMAACAEPAPGGFHVVSETRAACGIDARSEALSIYDEKLVDGIPRRALVASRGCADPVSRAGLQPGERVLDLGCGGGVDAIIASRMVGPEGKVYGLDMTPEMVKLARENAQAAGAGNVEFIEGTIEDVPLPDASLDAVLSNCVINFAADKKRVFSEAARVLRPGGRLVASDIVCFSELPADAADDMAALTGCTAGIPHADAYLRMLEEAGFSEAKLEPKTLYTMEILEEKARRKGRMELFSRLAGADVGAKTGSVVIIARK